MKYITVEQYLRSDIKVQDAVMEWWKPSKGDLYDNGSSEIQSLKGIYKSLSMFETDIAQVISAITQRDVFECGYIPLLTVGQLIEFIEDKTNGKLDIGYVNYKTIGQKISFSIADQYSVECDTNDLLKALWKFAQKIILY